MQDLLLNSSRLDSSDNDNTNSNIYDSKNLKMMIRSNRYQQELLQQQHQLKQNQQKQKNFKELLLQKQNEKLKQMELNQANLIKERDFLLNLINQLQLKLLILNLVMIKLYLKLTINKHKLIPKI